MVTTLLWLSVRHWKCALNELSLSINAFNRALLCIIALSALKNSQHDCMVDCMFAGLAFSAAIMQLGRLCKY